jgi:RNA polymerase sigma factor (sigma-70 family)
MSSESRSKLHQELEQVYSTHAPRLRAIGGKSHSQDAADVVHDAFVKALAAGRRQTIRDPLHFVFKITRNTVLSRLRDRVRREQRDERSTEEREELIDTAAGTEQVVLASERLGRAMDIISRMPPRRREAFLLHRMEELSYAEAARRMGISPKAIEKHISLAMAQLHREMDEPGPK